MPVDQAEHRARRQPPADQQESGDQQHALDVRQRRREQEQEEEAGERRLDQPRPIELGRGTAPGSGRCWPPGVCATATRPPGRRSRGRQAQAARRRSGSARNRAAPTSPIRMFCGLPMMVAAEPALAPPASAITNGRGSRPRCASPAHNSGVIANTTTSLASTAERTPPAATVPASNAAGGMRGARDPRRAPVVEAAGGELGREDHQPEQDDQGGEIDRCERRRAIDRAAAVEHDRAEQGDTGAIDLEPRPAAERHAEIDGREDDEDEAGQADGVTAAGTSAAASRPVRSAGARHRRCLRALVCPIRDPVHRFRHAPPPDQSNAAPPARSPHGRPAPQLVGIGCSQLSTSASWRALARPSHAPAAARAADPGYGSSAS